MKHLIKIESTPHGVLGVRHKGLDQQYCEAGELVTLKWQPDAKWGLQEAHYTDGDGNIVPIDLGNGNGVVAFMMPDKNITIGGTFKMFVSQDWTEGTNPSKGEVLTVGNNGEPTPISVDELANEIAEGDNNLVDSIDAINPFKGWYANLATLQASHPSPQVGDYAYVKGAESTDPAAIYECTTAGSWSDSGRTADTSNVQTFASGEEVNETSIDDVPALESEALVKSGGVITSQNKMMSDDFEIILDGKLERTFDMTSIGWQYPDVNNFYLRKGWYILSSYCETFDSTYPISIRVYDKNGTAILGAGLSTTNYYWNKVELTEDKPCCSIRIYSEKQYSGIKFTLSKYTSLESVTSNSARTLGFNFFIDNPYYYHFNPNGDGAFIKDGNNLKTVPSQSLYDVMVAARLGFRVMEFNCMKTSDGKFICSHALSGGKLGTLVKSADTDVYTDAEIQSWVITSHTLSDIKTYMRYNSDVAKYCTELPTLGECLKQCKENNIIPLVGCSQEESCARQVIEQYGYNVILYTYPSNIRQFFKGCLLSWKDSSSTTKDELLNNARNYGAPYIICLGTNSINKLKSDNTYEAFIKEAHDEGFILGYAYGFDNTNLNLFAEGFDVCGSSHQVNDFDWNYEIFDIDDTSNLPTTTGTINNGVVTLANGDTITCGATSKIHCGKGLLKIRFSGTISLIFGRFGNTGRVDISSDGSRILTFSDYFYNRQTRLSVTSTGNTVVDYFVYKTSKC